MKRFSLIMLVIALLAVSAQAQNNCTAKLFIINYNWDTPQQQTPNGLSPEQLNWWLKDGQKKFKNICLTDTQKDADYVLMWAGKSEDGSLEIVTPKVTTSQESGTVRGTSTSSSGASTTTTGTYEGTRTTRSSQRSTYEYSVEYVGAYLYKRQAGEKPFGSMPIAAFSHKGEWRWSKPDKDVLVDAVKYIARQSKR